MKLGERLLIEEISLEASLDFISDGLMVINSRFEILMFNKAAKSICGVVADGDYKFWPQNVGVFEADRQTLFDPDKLPLARAIRGETVEDIHLDLKNEHLQEWKTVSCNASPLINKGEIVGAILTFRDITELLLKDQQISKERAFYKKILNSFPAYVFSKDMEGKYTFMNDKLIHEFKDKFGSGPDEKSGWDSSFYDDLVISTKTNQEFEEEYFHSETGKKVWLRTTRIPLLNPEEEVYEICGIAYDISADRERKRSLEEEKAKIATASKLAALGMLAAEMGHEINNPLAIIRTSSWIMRKILNAETIQKELALGKLDEIDATVQRISDIVISVKNLSRDSSGEKKNKFLLSDILRDVQSICGSKFQSKSIRFLFDEKNPLLKKDIECFRVQLSEVFINLIVNAVDAVENVVNPWIKFEVMDGIDSFVFRVTDCGAGVPPEIEKKIFTPFFSTKEIGKGTGLGLSISKEIMQRQGGNLVLNRSISPSCFEVTLPIEKNR